MAKVIGLTGGIACGKSTVSQYLRERGLPIVDADIVARQVVTPGSKGLAQIKEIFGWQYILPDGTLNREPWVVLDAALLLEEEAYRQLADVVWVVTVREEIQLGRLIARNHYSIQQAKARIAAQMGEEERLQYADAVIDNNGTMEETWRQVEQLCAELFAQ